MPRAGHFVQLKDFGRTASPLLRQPFQVFLVWIGCHDHKMAKIDFLPTLSPSDKNFPARCENCKIFTRTSDFSDPLHTEVAISPKHFDNARTLKSGTICFQCNVVLHSQPQFQRIEGTDVIGMSLPSPPVPNQPVYNECKTLAIH